MGGVERESTYTYEGNDPATGLPVQIEVGVRLAVDLDEAGYPFATVAAVAAPSESIDQDGNCHPVTRRFVEHLKTHIDQDESYLTDQIFQLAQDASLQFFRNDYHA